LSDVFISYARSTEAQAQAIGEALRALGYGVWRDDELPAHRAYSDVIEERLRAAKAVVVIWSAEAVKSHWVRAEADAAREAGTLVQLSVDGATPPMPFNQIQCADLAGWSGDNSAPGWRKVVASIADLVGGALSPAAAPLSDAPLPLPSKPSIAVMPFANLSNDPDQEYFADGMMEEIVNALSRFRSLFVIASGSTLSFKGKTVSPHEVARQLGVRYVLEGSVRRAANRVRIAVKLIDAGDGAQIWGDRFDDTLEDVFALQDRVALSVAGVIEPAVETAEIRRASKRPTENMGSYDLYLRALPLFYSFERAETLQALDLLDRAIALDPDFSEALALAAVCHTQMVGNSWCDDPDSLRRRGIELANRALRVGGDDAVVLARCAIALMQLERNQDRAAALMDRAIALNPGSALVWQLSGVVQTRAGAPEIAIEHLATAMRLDPVSDTNRRARAFMAVARFEQGAFAEARELLGAATTGQNPMSYLPVLAATLGHLRRPSQAQDALSRYRALSSGTFEDFATDFFHRPEHRKLFLDGIALADGKAPSDIAPGA
jgi:adenylate cyclase